MPELNDITAIAEQELPTNGVQKEADKRPGQSYWSLVKHQYRKNKFAVVAFYIVMVMAFIAIFADFLANDKPIVASYNGTTYFPVVKDYLVSIGIGKWPSDLVLADWHDLKLDWAVWTPVRYESRDQDLANTYAAPFTGDHYLGTDAIGRDVLAGLVHGARISLTIGFVAAGIAVIIGVLLGAMAGYYGGWVDILISRLIEIFLNFPTLFLILTVVAFMRANIFMVMAVIGIIGWTGIARLTRGEVLRVRNM
ncbi:MAG TPA: ABC transporter permease subunit, partial [Candidatus Kapabacteria bacterium]|nr:ABC transporter permease subunit [Candidatus Kapabacteria bacterium]